MLQYSKPQSGRPKFLEKTEELCMEHVFGLVISSVFIVLVLFSVWYMLGLPDCGEPTDD